MRKARRTRACAVPLVTNGEDESKIGKREKYTYKISWIHRGYMLGKEEKGKRKEKNVRNIS